MSDIEDALSLSDVVAIVPMRAGSKGLADKNIKPLSGKPLYKYAVEAALSAGIGRVLISTDISGIDGENLSPKVEVLDRPDALATDTTPMAEVLAHVLQESVKPEQTVVLLQPTSPLRQSNQIREAIEVYQSGACPLLMSVCEKDRSILKYGFVEGDSYRPVGNPHWVFSNRQSLPPVYGPNGAIYIFNAAWFLQNGGFATPDIAVYEMDKISSLDIDTPADFVLCEAAINNLRNQEAEV